MAWYPFESASNHYHGITFDVPKGQPVDFFALDDFEGDVVATWKPVRVIVSKDKKRKRGDFPCFSNFPPIFGARAVEVLRPFLTHCDLLPLDCADEPLVAINPPKLHGALDCEKSKVDWFVPGKHAMTIHRYVLRGDQVPGEPIFRLAERRSLTLLSEAFHEAVVRNGLKGLLFFPLDATWEP